MSTKLKCNYCGAPNKSILGICEYCNAAPNLSINLKILSGKNIKPWFVKSKNLVNHKLIKPLIILVENQRIISSDQIKLFGNYAKKGFSNKRNVFLILAIPLSFHLYMRLNYPTTAKPFYPDFPYKMPIPEETGDFIIYGNNHSKENLALSKFLCRDRSETQTHSDCINKSYGNYTYHIDLGSEKKEENWFVYKIATKYKTELPIVSPNDLAINCKKGLIAYYKNAPMSVFYQMKSLYPSSYGYKEEQQFKRQKPIYVMRKMGKLWWASGDYEEDLETGRYLSSDKSQIKRARAYLSEKIAKKNPTKSDLETTNFARKDLKNRIRWFNSERLSRKAKRKTYTNLYKKVCNRVALGLFL